MKSLKTALVSFAALSMLVLAGCAGPEGPMGPIGATGATGPAGPGTQTTYIFDVDPTLADGIYEATVSPIEVDGTGEDYSTVSCYIYWTADADAQALPYTDPVSGATFHYSIEDGIVNLNWTGATSDPDALEFIVTLVNN